VDPLAHTLLGAALAEAGLKRLAPRAAAALIIGANLPDIDAVTMLVDVDTSLLLRRGWTHGPLGLALLPVLLVAGILAVDRKRWREAPHRAGPPHAGRLLALAWLASLTHPALDWLNTYGIRLLMPFDDRWFYGDALFIADPWMWLLPGAGAFLGRSCSRRSLAGWSLLAALGSLVVLAGPAPASTSVLWLAGLGALAALRASGRAPALARLAARAGLALLGLYVAAMVAGSRLAERQAIAWLSERGTSVEQAVALPLPGRSLAREVVALTPDRYRLVAVDWTGAGPREADPPRPRRAPGEAVRAALTAPSVAGLRGWLRLCDWEVRPEGNGQRVILRDLRYARDAEPGFGVAVVRLDAAGRPLPP
jgi:inner membrane protein